MQSETGGTMKLASFSLALVTTAAIAVGPASAGKLAGVTLPDKVTVGNQQLTLNGMGLREATWLKVDVYVAGLYVAHPSADPAALVDTDEPKMLVLRFVRDVDRDDIQKAWSEGMARNATVPMSKLQPYLAELNAWMPAFKEGDTLVFTYLPGQGVAVEVNKVHKGVIKDRDFARSLFAIWLGRNPPTAALKRGLLGRG